MHSVCLSLCLLLLWVPSSILAQSANVSEDGFRDGLLLQRVLQRYTNAYGGMRDVELLNSILISGTQFKDGEQYKFQLRKTRPGLIRYSLRKGPHLTEAGYDGNVGWLRVIKDGVSKVELLSGDSLQALKEEADFDGPLFRHSENPENSVRVDSMQRVEGEEAYVVRVASPHLPVRLFYLKKQNSFLLQVETLDESGEVVLQTRYRDYRYVGGFPFAFEVENRVKGETLALTRIEEVDVNPGLLSFMFEMPES